MFLAHKSIGTAFCCFTVSSLWIEGSKKRRPERPELRLNKWGRLFESEFIHRMYRMIQAVNLGYLTIDRIERTAYTVHSFTSAAAQLTTAHISWNSPYFLFY